MAACEPMAHTAIGESQERDIEQRDLKQQSVYSTESQETCCIKGQRLNMLGFWRQTLSVTTT